ncbi:MAG: hypothetical protein A2W91_03720 [Bacteroidetes bacterium GWF2_38_335]|nr:MAG: hypothetical protein A2W91_03720 [Bacteroidetes bacterium GWF2_38_335]OFY77408.1 MAG: hypothetical protein A2281_01040 [Bacteroidetes bacterium RIFOXYA12_FULL_38_20]HBS87304.1 hypothetical protein [Bacteroidales bacterium]
MRKLLLVFGFILILCINLLVSSCSFFQSDEKKVDLSITIKISLTDVIKSFTVNQSDSLFKMVMDSVETKIAKGDDFFELLKNEWDGVEGEKNMAVSFYSYQMPFDTDRNVSETEVLNFLKTQTDLVIDQTISVLGQRLELYGCEDYSIEKTDVPGVINLEIKGIVNSKKMNFIIESKGKIEFWETYENMEIFPYLKEINDSLKSANESGSEDTVEQIDTANSESFEEFARNNPLFSVLTPWVDRNNQLGEGPVVGYATGKDTTIIMQHLSKSGCRSILPAKIKFLWTANTFDEEGKYFQLIAIKKRMGNEAPIEGSVISNAFAELNEDMGTVAVYMEMTSKGASDWEYLTRQNIGKSIAIVLDDKVYSFPMVQSEITNGNSMISGNFSKEEANMLALIIKIGKMPVKTKILKISEH